MANARLLVKAEYFDGTQSLLAFHRGKFRVWTGTSWPILKEPDLKARIAKFFEHAIFVTETKDGPVEKPFQPNKGKVSEIVEALRAVTLKDSDRRIPSWDDPDFGPSPEDILPMENGLLYLPARGLLKSTPTFFNAYALPYAYEAEAPRPERWLRFLDELFGDDEEAKRLLQEWMGYLLTPDTSLQKILLMIGPMRSGKGTIGRVIRALLGEHNVAGTTLASLCGPHGLQELVDKPAAITSDARLPRGRETTTAIERLLSISGEDPLSVNPKYKDPFTVKLPTRITIMTNELPRLVDTSGALVSRLLVLRFRESFLGREDPGLLNDLLGELPGILLWALEGRDRLHERGSFVQPESGRDLIDDLNALSSPVSAFIVDRCVTGPDQRVEIDVIYQQWIDWCETNGHIAGSKNGFLGKLRAVIHDLEVIRGSGEPRKREYVGIGLSNVT